MLSTSGLLRPVESVAALPVHALSGVFNDLSQGVGGLVDDLTEIQGLRNRVAELEEALALFQPEVVELREISNDYRRLTELLNYRSAALNQETLVAEVISYDQNSLRRTILINRGARDGITRGMPVVTNEGLVGRVTDVFANASRVLLITDPSSSVSARLQTSRAQGSIVGLLTGGLRMEMIPLEANVEEGDIVITSGLGGNFPADLLIGQVVSRRQFEFDLNQTAEVRSLIDFNTLEFVLVVTNFQPVDLSTFEETTEEEQ
ncbi:MAG: rod shape-determining protein MreC [Anaerolineae bacterium]